MKSKTYLIYCILVFGVGLVVFCYKSILPAWKVAELADQGIWLEEKTSKGMLLAKRETPPDVIFVGASTTQNHTATEVFAKAGIDIFNYGLPGLYLEDYPYVVEQAIAARPKMIAIQLPISHLWKLSCPFAPNWVDVVAHIRVRGLRNGCDLIHDALLYQIPSVRYKDFLLKYNVADTERHVEELLSLKKTRPVILEFQSQINYIRGIPGRFVMTLKSGDGLVLNVDPKTSNLPIKPKILKSVGRHVLGMLEVLTQKILAAGIRPVIVLLPTGPAEHWQMEGLPILASLNTPVIRGENFADGTDYWEDLGHFGYRGRIAWSRWLEPQVRQLLGSLEHL